MFTNKRMDIYTKRDISYNVLQCLVIVMAVLQYLVMVIFYNVLQ